MKLGYIRVSTKEQNPDRQIEELRKYGVEDRFLFIDRLSGTKKERPQFTALKSVVREGDEVYVHELDRLGRNKQTIYEELSYFKKAGVIVRILDVPTTLIDYKNHGDMSKMILDMVNNLLLEVLSTLAEHEINKIHKRQAEGIKLAIEKGVKFGRKAAQITPEFIAKYDDWKAKKVTATQAAKDLAMCKQTFYKLIKKHEKKQ